LFKITIATLSDILLLSGWATYCMHMRGHLNVRTCTTQYILLHRKPRKNRNRTQYFLTNSKKKKKRQKADCTDSAIVCIEVCAATSMLTSTQYNRISFTEKQK
jgi:hypothetical protein